MTPTGGVKYCHVYQWCFKMCFVGLCEAAASNVRDSERVWQASTLACLWVFNASGASGTKFQPEYAEICRNHGQDGSQRGGSGPSL